ncbi:hypothetical protein C8R47DRAFT_786816 [Mycena vitilis]|nr:hypothetical protein C8R47DRAFT_786816 [Mycena vitilis]
MFPPEVVEQIIHHGWNCLSSSSQRHAFSMSQWMLVSRDWLNIVLSVVFRDLWITSRAHIQYILDICDNNASFICTLAGISDVHQHLTETCKSLTISVYHPYEGQYADMCAQLIGYATTEVPRNRYLVTGIGPYSQEYAIPQPDIATVISGFTPHITSLHFVFIDCNATYRDWNSWKPSLNQFETDGSPLSLVELHVTFAYTSPPPALLLDAPRGTFFPPSKPNDMPLRIGFQGVKTLVVWHANADFVAFLSAACPRLETVKSTAKFGAEDVPATVGADVKARLIFVHLPHTTEWPGVTSGDTVPLPSDWLEQRLAALRPSKEEALIARVPTMKNPIWRLANRLFGVGSYLLLASNRVFALLYIPGLKGPLPHTALRNQRVLSLERPVEVHRLEHKTKKCLAGLLGAFFAVFFAVKGYC